MTERLSDLRKSVELALLAALKGEEKAYGTVVKAMNYSLLAGGKRIRPVILLLFFELCGGKAQEAMPFAAALEMIHTYSLIHDDLPCMDNDDFRRGRPSNHVCFGEDMALLAGDGLLTQAFGQAVSCRFIPTDRVVKAIGILAERAGYHGMIGGQVIDLESENKPIDEETITLLNELKTGCLLQAAAEIGCVLAGADESLVKAAGVYGQKVGLAFQLVDDLLDIRADASVLGKPTGSDAKNGKSTFVSLYGEECCRLTADRLTNEALDCLKVFPGDIRALSELTKDLLIRSY